MCRSRLKVMLVASTGGHLSQLAAMRSHWRDVDVHWVTFDKQDARSKCCADGVTWAFHPTTRNIPNAIRNLFLAFKVIRQVSPDVILSNGAGIAFPFFVIARWFRIPSVYMEVYDRVGSPTLTGRLCYPICDEFLLQWDVQHDLYPSGVLVGTVY